MDAIIERLAWDSEFFGVPIARADLTRATPEKLRAIDAAARGAGIQCLYGFLEPGIDDGSLAVQEHGYRLMDVAIACARPPGPFVPPKPTRSRVRRGEESDLARLEPIVEDLAPWSRFAVDPRFGREAARRLYRAWLRRAATGGSGYQLLIAEDEDGITGLATNVWSPVPRLDILASIKPGTGASYALVGGLFEWAAGLATEAGPIASRNLACLRCIENSGFRPARTRYIFHRWLDEPSD